jgi:hypothetical protein
MSAIGTGEIQAARINVDMLGLKPGDFTGITLYASSSEYNGLVFSKCYLKFTEKKELYFDGRLIAKFDDNMEPTFFVEVPKCPSCGK